MSLSVTVVLNTGEEIPFELALDCTFRSLKEEIFIKEGIEPERQTLYYNGMPIPAEWEHQSISSCVQHLLLWFIEAFEDPQPAADADDDAEVVMADGAAAAPMAVDAAAAEDQTIRLFAQFPPGGAVETDGVEEEAAVRVDAAETAFVVRQRSRAKGDFEAVPIPVPADEDDEEEEEEEDPVKLDKEFWKRTLKFGLVHRAASVYRALMFNIPPASDVKLQKEGESWKAYLRRSDGSLTPLSPVSTKEFDQSLVASRLQMEYAAVV